MTMAAHPAFSPDHAAPADTGVERADLALDAAEANAFYTPALLDAARAHLGGLTPVELIDVREGTRLIGLMPVERLPQHGRMPIACVTNWMHRHCFFGAPLIRRGHEAAAWRGFLTQLDERTDSAAFLHMQGLDAAGANAAAIEAVCVEQRRGWREIHRYDRAMLRSDLGADAYWESQIRPKKRKELRRLQKRLAEMGQVDTRLLRDSCDLTPWCDAFLTLEASGWKGREGSALACSADDDAFFRAACADAFAQGTLHMVRIDLDRRPIAMLVNFRHLAGAFSFKIAIDEALGRFSPGVLIEIANLHAVQDDPAIAWMDSCAAAGHPMIDSLWAERRTMVQYRIALKGKGASRLWRAAAFALTNAAEDGARFVKGQA